jgi:hypothetical protein
MPEIGFGPALYSLDGDSNGLVDLLLVREVTIAGLKNRFQAQVALHLRIVVQS